MQDDYEVRVILREGMHFEALTTAGDEFAMQLDSDPEFGGRDLGNRPLDLLLVSLAGCSGMDVLSILRKKQERVTGFEVRVRGERATEHPKVHTHIWVEFIVTGSGIQPGSVERSIELVMTRYCPVANLLRQVVPITTSYEIVEG